MIGFVIPPSILEKATSAPQPKRRMKLWNWVLLLVLYLLFCYWFFYPEPIRYIPIQPTAAERAYHKQRLKYHGLASQVSVIIEEEGKVPYFYRDGKRCRF